MRVWLLLLCLSGLCPSVLAADACPRLSYPLPSAEPAQRIAAAACQEHLRWYRPFIDRQGRLASRLLSEAEAQPLADDSNLAWRRVAGYWQESGLLRTIYHQDGASDCERAVYGNASAPACRGFVIDNAWSAVFVSWVMMKAAVPGFRPSASHVSYVRDAILRPDQSPYLAQDPAHAVPAVGDMLCYVRQPGRVYGYAGLLQAVRQAGGLYMHCDIVTAANPDGDSTAYLVGGNVQQSVTMRLLPLNREGALWNLPMRSDAAPPCSPDQQEDCSFNRQDWAVLLKLKPASELARLAPAQLLQVRPAWPSTPAPQCCINCVLGSGVPRCPTPRPANQD